MQPVINHETREQTAERVAGMIDHTLLKPTATEEQIRALCAEATDPDSALDRLQQDVLMYVGHALDDDAAMLLLRRRAA